MSKDLHCPHCLGATSVTQFDPTAQRLIADWAAAGDFIAAFEFMTKILGLSPRTAKFTFLHVTTSRGVCVRCARALEPPGAAASYCPRCSSLNLDWADQVRHPAYRPLMEMALTACPECSSPLAKGVTKCWARGCDYVLPKGFYASGGRE